VFKYSNVQFDVTCFIISLSDAQHVSKISTSNLRILRLTCRKILRLDVLTFETCWAIFSLLCRPIDLDI